MTAVTTNQGPAIDVMLLLEGTFPYVAGGVSSWVNQIIKAHPQLRFGIAFLGSRRSDYGEMRYALPDNIVHLETHFLYEEREADDAQPAPRDGHKPAFMGMRELHEHFLGSNTLGPDQILKALADIQPGGRITREDFLHSRASWDNIVYRYRERCIDPSFVDYFWTVRIMHEPLWTLATVAHELPPARCYHTVSTGYAGFLGAMLAARYRRPLILSEHGIYTKERKIDLFQNEWIKDNRNVFQRDHTELSYFRQLWIRFFQSLGRMCYDAADPIVALYETNRLRQIADGAEPSRTTNVPNGVSLGTLAPLRELRPADPPPVLCLIGRVVQIKDIKTFIRAMRTVVNECPDAEGWIAGPEDEDPEYAQECRNLVESLGLENHVRFLGFQRITELMPKVGVLILSSISEALPLVILEGYAAGVPSVVTDVGSCRQLIEGLGDEDRALGQAGRVVGIADPAALAAAALELLLDPAAWHAAQAAGIARVERYYTDTQMFARYRAIYEDALVRSDAAAEG